MDISRHCNIAYMSQFPSPVVSLSCSCNSLGVFGLTLFMYGSFSIIDLDLLIIMFCTFLFSVLLISVLLVDIFVSLIFLHF